MNYPTKSKVNVAVANNNKFDLTKQVVTTHDFGRVKAIECRYMVPGDKFNIKLSSFTRLLPMVSPTFGKIDTIQRAFFVPIRSLIPKFYDWVSNQPTAVLDSDGQGGVWSTDSVIPRTYMKSFVNAFCQPRFSTILEVAEGTVPSVGEFDFVINVVNSSTYPEIKEINSGENILQYQNNYFKFTDEGRKMYDFFKSMGLNINFEPSYKNVMISLLPILAFWKAYIDWIVPSRFVKDYPVNIKHLLLYFQSDENGNVPVDFTSSISAAKIFVDNFMHYPLSFYKNDYFTSAWLKPFQQDVLASDAVIPNLGTTFNSQGNSVRMGGAGTSPVSSSVIDNGVGSHIIGNNSSNEFINYFTIQSLGKLQDYLNRGMLAGSKVQDWLETEFGLRPSTDALNLSTYLGKISDTIMIDDIYSQADTHAQGGELLGAYAGRGKKGTMGTFKYASREHGFFIITTEIVPKTSYTQGLIPEFNMLDRFDFFQPEFDNLGVQAIAHKELFCSPQKYIPENGTTPQTLNPESIFGFVPRYANLKTSFDVLSGDFGNRYGEYLKSWYLNRDVEKMLADSVAQGDGVISVDWCTVDKDLQNWENMFAYVDVDIDHFYQIFVIQNSASRPMISLEDALNPEHPNGSKSITVKTHGGVE